jgi:hypothetical protein
MKFTDMEIWKHVVNYHEYEVSSLGRIRRNGKCLKPKGKVYAIVNLSKDGIVGTFRLHRLIAETFLPNPESLKVVNHKDGNKLNNILSNLEWTTYSGNALHAKETGLINHTSKKVKMVTCDGNVTIFSSKKEAIDSLGISEHPIKKRSGIYHAKNYSLTWGDDIEERNLALVWKPVPGFDDFVVSECGEVWNIKTRSKMIPHESYGYLKVNMKDSLGIKKHVLVHRAVASAFLDNPEKYPVVNHKNGNKKDNNLENLEYCSHARNAAHAVETGLVKRTTIVQKIDPITYEIIGTYDSFKDAAREYGKVGWRINIGKACTDGTLFEGCYWRLCKKRKRV